MKYFMIAAVSALSINDINNIHNQNIVDGGFPSPGPIYAPQLHWNEDPHSVPEPLRGAPYLTSTQARFIAENSTANAYASEPKGDAWWYFNYGPYNADATEYVQTADDLADDSLVMTSSQTGATWRVIPDYGEKDHNVVLREMDSANGKKFSGWTNPLGWTDDGTDDDLVL